MPRGSLGDELPQGAAVLEGDGVDGHVLLPFGEFDWLEEDEPVIGHPHDPFSRIDVLHSTREVRVELDGVELAPSSTYRIVTNSFLADGGDAFTVFREGSNRVGGGDDLAALVAYLASDRAANITGADFTIDGGLITTL